MIKYSCAVQALIIKHQSLNIFSDQFKKVFETYIRVGISEQAQIVAEKILAAKKAVVALTMNSPTGMAQRNGMAGGYRVFVISVQF